MLTFVQSHILSQSSKIPTKHVCKWHLILNFAHNADWSGPVTAQLIRERDKSDRIRIKITAVFMDCLISPRKWVVSGDSWLSIFVHLLYLSKIVGLLTKLIHANNMLPDVLLKYTFNTCHFHHKESSMLEFDGPLCSSMTNYGTELMWSNCVLEVIWGWSATIYGGEYGESSAPRAASNFASSKVERRNGLVAFLIAAEKKIHNHKP